MTAAFEELDWQQTAMGELSLRRRVEPSRQVDVFEVKLGDEFLMSSLFTVAETALADLALAAVGNGTTAQGRLDVVVGGLGLGYTAAAVLRDERVRSLVVVEALAPVIDWHERGLVPTAETLTSDPRCRLVLGDFFALAAAGHGFTDDGPRRYDAVLVDIDHSPRHVLHPSHAAFYTPEGLRRLRESLRPGGVFGLWSDDPPDAAFVGVLDEAFDWCVAHVVSFPNFYTGTESSNTVYVARI